VIYPENLLLMQSETNQPEKSVAVISIFEEDYREGLRFQLLKK